MQAIKKWRIIQFSLFRSQIRREGHTPVLVETSIDELDLLNLEPNGKIIDCTFGAGGHTSLILGNSFDDGTYIMRTTKVYFVYFGNRKITNSNCLCCRSRRNSF